MHVYTNAAMLCCLAVKHVGHDKCGCYSLIACGQTHPATGAGLVCQDFLIATALLYVQG